MPVASRSSGRTSSRTAKTIRRPIGGFTSKCPPDVSDERSAWNYWDRTLLENTGYSWPKWKSTPIGPPRCPSINGWSWLLRRDNHAIYRFIAAEVTKAPARWLRDASCRLSTALATPPSRHPGAAGWNWPTALPEPGTRWPPASSLTASGRDTSEQAWSPLATTSDRSVSARRTRYCWIGWHRNAFRASGHSNTCTA